MAPICILSLVAPAIGGQSDLGMVLQTIGWLFAAFMVGILGQFFFVYCKSLLFDYWLILILLTFAMLNSVF